MRRMAPIPPRPRPRCNQRPDGRPGVRVVARGRPGLPSGARCTTMKCMSRSEVYSWRLSRETRALLEAAAREEGASVARILERIATEWLDRRRDRDGEDRQAVLREAVAPCIGSLAGGDPGRSRRVREDLREKLRTRHRNRTS